MAGVLYRLGRLCANRAVVVVAVWLGVVVLVRLVVWGVGAETGNDLSLPGTESQQATDLLGSRFPPQQNGSSPIVFHVTKGKITDAANKQAVESSYKALAKAPHVASAPDPFANAASGLPQPTPGPSPPPRSTSRQPLPTATATTLPTTDRQTWRGDSGDSGGADRERLQRP
jgi:uncharacterized membrane protein YdfJ with MMPL/SSD domain